MTSADSFHIIIPARYQSTRLPGKLLKKIGGKTVLERVYRQALLAKPQSIIIATDNEAIREQAHAWGAEVQMTASHHLSGTDRIAEVVARGGYHEDDIIVNVQGDEPFIDPHLVQQVADILQKESKQNSSVSMATLCWPIANLEQFHNPNTVKVVRDNQNNALYFSRQAIPMCRDNPSKFEHAFRHIGLYAYRANFLLDFVKWPHSVLEGLEALEQLRVLDAGYSIRVEQAVVEPLQDINTAEDLAAAEVWYRCL